MAIPDSGGPVVTSTINVAGAGAFINDVDVRTKITHTFPGDLDITLTSPAGTIVTISSDNAGGNDNVWNDTRFDDQADPDGVAPYATNDGLVNDHGYAANVTAPALVPEEPLASLIGEDPNGVWTITLDDDAGGDTGTLNSWGLDIQTLAAAPGQTRTFNTGALPDEPIPDSGGPLVISTAQVSGAGSNLTDLDAFISLRHTFPADLDITLTSPAGTSATITTDNAGTNDDVFRGTLFDNDANPGGLVPYATNDGLVSDHGYVVGVTASPLTPEESFAAFSGENPNGTWTLRVDDDAGGDTGRLLSWALRGTTSCGEPPVAVDDAKTVAENSGATTIDVLANDTDADGDPLTIASKTNGAHGTVAITNSGADLTYTPDADYSGPDAFTYTLNGGSTARVSVTVVDVADPTPPLGEYPRTLKLSYSAKKDKFKGKLTSSEAACVGAQKVKLYEQKKGKDPKLGKAKTNEAGKYSLKEKNAEGKFYSRVKQTSNSAGTCLAAKSKKVKVG